MTLSMKSKATNTATGVAITFGNFQKVVGAVATVRAGNAVAVVVTISTNIVTVTPAADAGGTTGFYDVVADCI